MCDLENSKYSSRFDRDCCYKFLWNLEDVEKILSRFLVWTIPHEVGIVHRSVNLMGQDF